MKTETVITLPKFYIIGFIVGMFFFLSLLIPTYLYLYTNTGIELIVLSSLAVGVPTVWAHTKLAAWELRTVGHCANAISIVVALERSIRKGMDDLVPENKEPGDEV